MPTAEKEPGDVLTDASVIPLAVSLRSPHALDPGLVGDGTCLLATASRLGLPVADGAAVTMAGVADDEHLHALKHAWLRTRGPVRVMLSDMGRPVSLEAVRTPDNAWVITDLRYKVSQVVRNRQAG